MRPLKRKHVSKYKSAKAFKATARKTKAANLPVTPMRGGFRL